jgi:hypothetical protein
LGLVVSRGNNADIIAERVGWHQETGWARRLGLVGRAPLGIFISADCKGVSWAGMRKCGF